MQLAELQQRIVQGTILQCHIFCGEEVGIMDIYIDKIAEVLNADKIRTDSCLEAWQKMQKSRISKSTRLFIVRDDKELLKDEKLQQKLEKSNLPFSGSDIKDYLIVIYTTLDKRGKFYKSFKNDIIEFSKLSPKMLANYIDKILPGMSEKERVQLAEICDCDYSRIILECDKIKQYSKAVNISYGESLTRLVEKHVIFKPIGDITFKFTDAILTRNKQAVGEYLRQARLKGEPEIMVLSVLYNGFKQIFMVQGLGNDQRDVCKRTGLTAWQVKMAKEKMGHYSLEEILNALKVIHKAEKGIKTGQMDADIAMEYVIINIL